MTNAPGLSKNNSQPDLEPLEPKKSKSNGKKKPKGCMGCLQNMRSHIGYKIAYALIYGYLLLNDPFRYWWFHGDTADFFFMIVTISLMSFFVFDIFVTMFAVRGYFCRFFFWSDLIAIICIVFSATT